MKFRRVDEEHDWCFGEGLASYATQSEAVYLSIKTRLLSFLGDWFLDLEHGIAWIEQTKSKADLKRLEIPLRAYILETEGVKKITSFLLSFDEEKRHLMLEFSYMDIYGQEKKLWHRGKVWQQSPRKG